MNICLQLVVCIANNFTNRHPVISCPIKAVPEEKPLREGHSWEIEVAESR